MTPETAAGTIGTIRGSRNPLEIKANELIRIAEELRAADYPGGRPGPRSRHGSINFALLTNVRVSHPVKADVDGLEISLDIPEGYAKQAAPENLHGKGIRRRSRNDGLPISFVGIGRALRRDTKLPKRGA